MTTAMIEKWIVITDKCHHFNKRQSFLNRLTTKLLLYMPNHDANFGAKNRKRTGKNIRFFRFRSGFLSIEKFSSGSVCQKNSRLTGFSVSARLTGRFLFVSNGRNTCPLCPFCGTQCNGSNKETFVLLPSNRYIMNYGRSGHKGHN